MDLDDRATLWLAHIKTWQQSGATQDAYCETNALHPKTFSNWKRRLRKHFPDLPNLTRATVVPPIPVAPLVSVRLIDEPNDTFGQTGPVDGECGGDCPQGES